MTVFGIVDTQTNEILTYDGAFFKTEHNAQNAKNKMLSHYSASMKDKFDAQWVIKPFIVSEVPTA